MNSDTPIVASYASLLLSVICEGGSGISVHAHVEHDGKISCYIKGATRIFDTIGELVAFIRINY